MVTFKQFFIELRDFCYHLNLKQGGRPDKFSLMAKLWGFFFSYFGAVVFIVTQTLAHFGILQKYGLFREMSFKTIVLGIIFFLLPTELFLLYMLRKVRDTPIPEVLPPEKYKQGMRRYAIGTVIGLLLMWGVGFYFVSFLRGRLHW